MKFLFVLVTLLSVNVFAKNLGDIKADKDACMNNALTTADFYSCGITAYKQADVELNIVYQEINKSFSKTSKPDQITKKRLLDAQRAWVTFRDTNCLMHSAQTAGGSYEKVITANCLGDMTLNRTQELLDLFGTYL